eukprot:scaffold9812_cov56-Phaeocystis_antarctica.AAC.2
MSRLRAIARSLRVPQSQNARCTLMAVGVWLWVGGSIVTTVLAAKPLYCSLGLVCDPLVQKLVFRALLGLWMRISASSEGRRNTHLRIKSPPVILGFRWFYPA